MPANCASVGAADLLCEAAVLFETLASALVIAIAIVGLPALVAVFFLKGAFVLKPVPASVVVPGYLLAVSPTPFQALAIACLCAAASVSGQSVVYRSVHRKGIESVNRFPLVSLEPSHVDRVTDWFHRYGAVTILGVSVFPGIRGTAVIPAALTSYPLSRTVAASFAGTFTYHSTLALTTVGILQIL